MKSKIEKHAQSNAEYYYAVALIFVALALLLVLLSGCATVASSRYEESTECPADMTETQYRSGMVRCIAACSSWGRDFATYHSDCKCECHPKRRAPTTSQM